MVNVYGYKKWSTVNKSLKFLSSENIPYNFFDFIANQIDKSTLIRIIEKNNSSIDELFNSKGVKFKQLGLHENFSSMSFDEKLSLLLSDGMLIKRPIIEFDNGVVFGFNESKMLEYISRGNI